ncbi:hypothetical protein [Nocardiopsis metallicus]|uniref:HEPN domain-containing protein n=1 Tax=Nocardiopsis metallicus TaxID=179819 RepID=A0A840VZ23_9ACTN|nr:hypothetical protein [Nocardiopsis metallicus]MBB5489062.1 hypothetical protein [Nocardiopsis metallicus]
MYQYIPEPLNLDDEALVPKHWPKGGQQLFRSEGAWHELTFFTDSREWIDYVWSFRSAAEMMYEAAFAVGAPEYRREDVFIPYAFLWRHYAELSLKALIAIHSGFLGKELDHKKLAGTHSLAQLWNWFEPLDAEALPNESSETRRNAGKIIAHLQKIDPKSMQFRYPVDKEGNPHLEGLDRLDMQNFHKVMLSYSTWIESVAEAIAHLSEA